MWLPVRTLSSVPHLCSVAGEVRPPWLATELYPVRTNCSMTLVCALDVGPSRHGQVRLGNRTTGRARELLAPCIPPLGPLSGHGHLAPNHGWPPVSPATIAPTGYPRVRPRPSLRGGRFPDRNARRAPVACVQRWGHTRVMSTIRHPGTRRGSGRSTDETDPLEQSCPNHRPRQRPIPLVANTPPCAGSPTPVCRRARTASNASRPDRTSLGRACPE